MRFKKKHTRIFLVEITSSLMFSLAYFILLGRVLSNSFTLNLLELSALVAFIYVIAIFVSSYRFEADLFPFYSLLRSLFERTWVPVWLNLPAQLLGTLLGFGMYVFMLDTVLTLSPIADIGAVSSFEIGDPWMHSFSQGVLVFILIYSILIIRKLFVLKGMTGTLLIAILVFVLSALSLPLDRISVIAWPQDMVLNVYHHIQRGDGWAINHRTALSAAVVLLTVVLAYVKASQYMRPAETPVDSAEPGEFAGDFNKDYDI
ncbi:MAG: hypothetical protein EA392_07185 [Cryomorphaceae bacterium]|nr:MAG: hypothetical protein EA392_07185 [Cryomorphaceae bacterium]